MASKHCSGNHGCNDEQEKFSDKDLQIIHEKLMEDKEEPKEGFSKMPIVLLFVLSALLFWGGIHLANHSGRFRSDIFDPSVKPKPQGINAVAFDPIVQGKKMYKKQCQQCHQESGHGLPGVYPTLVHSPWVLGSEERLVKLLLLGMSGPITVLGADYNGNMPAVGQWSNRDIASVLTYVRQEWGNEAGPISEDLVARIRTSLGARTNAWTPDELLKEHPLE